ncbi:WW domain superfamily [Sesbania bispinosa]|nr:WW domain superfamily [Sesbania bispinosa]
MEAITASLERSLQNCSLNNHNHQTSTEEDGPATDAGIGISSSSDDVADNHISNSDTTLELNSHISLPYHWEQCLDLKTGEIYYINWRNGMKAKEDPRRIAEYNNVSSRDYESEEESWYDSEESSSESCPSSSKEHYQEKQNVLVVAGCKSCLMYFMVPKQVEDCPKCTGQLLHFDRSENGSP